MSRNSSRFTSNARSSSLSQQVELALIDKQRQRIRDLSLILKHRRDEGMDVAKHDIT